MSSGAEGPITSPFHDMPIEQLVGDYNSRANSLVDPISERIDFRGAGLLLRSYTGLFNGAGPLASVEVLDDLSDDAYSALLGVASAAGRLIDVNKVDGSAHIGSSWDIDPKLDGDYDYCKKTLTAAQVGLELVDDMPSTLRGHALENELQILLGNIDPKTTPLLRVYGPSEAINKATIDLVERSRESFPQVMTACEMLTWSDNSVKRNSMVSYIATILGSQWRHPGYKAPSTGDNTLFL